MRRWDEQEKQREFPVEKIRITRRQRNIERLLAWQMKTHRPGTIYSEQYLDEIRKAVNSLSGRLGDPEPYRPNTIWDELV